MKISPRPTIAIPVAVRPTPRRKKTFRVCIAFALLFALCVARVEAQDDDYLTIMGVTDQADALKTAGKIAEAHAKYIEAQRALASFQTANPGWNARTVSYRLKFLQEKIAATAATSVASAATAQNDSSQPSVKLLAAGSEPRKVLRLHPAVGDKQTIVMTMKMAIEMGMAGRQMPAMDIPPIAMTMDTEVKNISAEGEIAYQLTITDATVDAGTNVTDVMANAMKTGLDGIRGMTGSGKMTTQGIVKAMEMKLPAGAAPQLSQTMGQMKDSFASSTIVLPEDAIGVGAKWEFRTRLKSQGMNIDQTAAYEVLAVDGDQLTLRSTITQSAANQKIESPAMPGMKVDLNKMTGTATGSTTQDLGKIMPTTGSLDNKADISMGMNIGQKKQSMDMKMTMKLTLETK